ncbi:MAG TPA: MAPEG family protein [Alphaproteobacteria bacterium]|nr:MAPEG family protein [Alphaproteobacteria bacterium]
MDDVPASGAAVPDFNVFGWPYTGFVTLFALLVYFAFAFRVGRARVKYNVPAPAMDGPPEFLCAMRVQMNTLEQLIVFLPLLWIAALSSRDEIAALIGATWPLARLIYAAGYTRGPDKRHMGFILGLLPLLALFLLAVVQLVRSALVWQ